MEVGASKIKKFKRVLRRDPNSSDANLGLALVHFRRGELVEALPYAQKASQMDPASAEAKALLGSIYMGLDIDAKAEESLSDAIKLNAANYDSYSRLAEVRYRRGDIAGAIRALQDAAELFPRNSQAFNDLGVMYYARGDLSEAEKQFNKAREVNAKDRDVLFNLSVVYLGREQGGKATEVLRQLMELEPGRAEHHASLGRAYQVAGNYEDAAKHFEKAVELRPQDAEAQHGLGVSLLQLGQRDASRSALERCLELQPEHTGAIFAMIGALASEEKTDEIIRLWERSADAVRRASKGRTAVRPRLSTGSEVTWVELMEKIDRAIAALPQETVELSAVVRAIHDGESMRLLHDRLTSALESIGKRYEIVYVEDGALEDTQRMLTEINHRDDRVRIVSLARAYGQAASLEAGFEHARGDMIVTFDGDLELHPEHIQKLLDKMAEGYDVVCGVPTATPARRKAKTFFANLVISTIAGVTVRERACALALYNRAAVKRVGLSGEIFLWLPLIAHGLGLATAEVPIEVHRCAGDESASERSYAIPPVLEVIAAQFLTNASPGPMRYFGKLSLWTVAVGVLISTLVLVWAIRANGDPAWIALPIALFALLAMLLIAIGFITEMVTRAHQQAHYRTSYVVKEVIE